MKENTRKIATVVLVFVTAYFVLGLVGVLPAQYDVTKGFSTALNVGEIEEYNAYDTDSFPSGITIDSAGYIWVTEWNAHAIIKMSTSGVILQKYDMPITATPHSIVYQQSTDSYFITDSRNSLIYRLDPDKSPAFSSWSAESGSFPTDISVDADDNIWFLSMMKDYIGILQSTGTIEYKIIPDADGTHPQAMVIDMSNDNIWVTMESTFIVKRTPSNSFTHYNIPAPSGLPAPKGIDMDSQGNLWFADAYHNKIGRLTQSGTFTMYTVPTKNAFPYDVMVNKATDEVWFTELYGNKIGRIVVNGSEYAFDEFRIPTAGTNTAQQLAIQSNEYIWFTEGTNNKIGKLRASAPSTPQPPLPEDGGEEPTPEQPAFVLDWSRVFYLIGTVFFVIIGIAINMPERSGKWRKA